MDYSNQPPTPTPIACIAHSDMVVEIRTGAGQLVSQFGVTKASHHRSPCNADGDLDLDRPMLLTWPLCLSSRSAAPKTIANGQTQQSSGQTDRNNARQPDRETDRQTDRQTGRQTDRQTDRQASAQPRSKTKHVRMVSVVSEWRPETLSLGITGDHR